MRTGTFIRHLRVHVVSPSVLKVQSPEMLVVFAADFT